MQSNHLDVSLSSCSSKGAHFFPVGFVSLENVPMPSLLPVAIQLAACRYGVDTDLCFSFPVITDGESWTKVGGLEMTE